MYKEHSLFLLPEDEETKVWRYMDVMKFLSMIDKKKLYFTIPDKFEDPFEGSLPQSMIDAINNAEFIPEKLRNDMRSAYKNLRKFCAISCWHVNNHESAAMWKVYLKSDEGIAVQSSIRRLKFSFDGGDDILIGCVKYIDYEQDIYDVQANLLESIVLKRKSFEYEQELRAMVLKWPENAKSGRNGQSDETIHHGIEISVDLDQLIESIVLAPHTPKWVESMLASILSRYEMPFEIKRSSLENIPMF